MKIIAFAGMPFSGKSVAVELVKHHNIPVVRMGDMVWAETKRQGRPLDDKNVGDVANSMRTQYGMDIWAKRTFEFIKTIHPTDVLVIDGIRNNEEIFFFKHALGSDFFVIAIDAPDEIRHQRGLSRGRADDSGNLKAIHERDERETRWGLREVIKNADMMIQNVGSLDEFETRISQLLEKIIKKR